MRAKRALFPVVTDTTSSTDISVSFFVMSWDHTYYDISVLTDFAKQTCFQISTFYLLHKLAYRCRYETTTTLVCFFVFILHLHLKMTLNIYVVF